MCASTRTADASSVRLFGEPGPEPGEPIGRPFGAVPTPPPERLEDDPFGPVVGALGWLFRFGIVEDGLEDCPTATPFVAESELLELPDDPAPAPPAPPPPWDQAALPETDIQTTVAIIVKAFIEAPVRFDPLL
jgi:hypothetical protein